MIAVIIFIGAMSGVFTAAGLFALITSVGVINRYADVSGTSRHVSLYEECIIIGAMAANAVYVLGITVRIGMTGCIIFGLISGIFIGTFLISLAEKHYLYSFTGQRQAPVLVLLWRRQRQEKH